MKKFLQLLQHKSFYPIYSFDGIIAATGFFVTGKCGKMILKP